VTTKPELRERARIVLWGIAIIGAVQAAGAYLAQRHAAAVVVQLVIAEFGTGRLGVAWSDPLAPAPTGTMMTKRALRGAAFGAAAAVTLVGASVLAHAATLDVGMFGVAPILVGLVSCAATGARDELVLRGLVLRALGPRASMQSKLAVCAMAGVAWRFGIEPGASWSALAFSGLAAAALGALWLRDRGAWLAVGANAAFTFVTVTLAQGSLLDVRNKAGLDATSVAVVCAVFFAASAIAYAGRKDVPSAR
jgi:hypothetical protein